MQLYRMVASLLFLSLSFLALADGTSPAPAASAAPAPGPRLDNRKLYCFSYTTAFHLDRAQGSRLGATGFNISSSVDINLVWRNPDNEDEQLLQAAISNVHIANGVSQRSYKRNIFKGASAESVLGQTKLAALQTPFMVYWKMGKVRSLFSTKGEPTTIRNLKRGLASMLMVQLRGGMMLEADVSGKCVVDYKVTKGNQVTRIKNLYTCKTTETGGFTTHSPVLGVTSQSSSVTSITLENNFIKSALAEETHTLSVNVRHSMSARIMSRQTLTLDTTEAGPEELAGKDAAGVVKSMDRNLISVGIVAQKVKSSCTKCPKLIDVWRNVKRDLEPGNLSKATAPRSFITLIQSLRKASTADILKVLANCSKTSLPQLVDAVTSAQTPASLEAILEFLDFSKKEGLVLQERFLYACGFASHPNEKMLQSLLDISNGKIGSTDIKESVVIIIGALVRKLCLKGGCELPTVERVKKMLLDGAERARQEAEVQMYLLALKNAVLPEAIPLLTRYAESAKGAFSTIAITALQRYDTALISKEVKLALSRVYHQNRRIYEKNIRVAAADVILGSKPTYVEVQNLLLSIGHLPREMNKYMVMKVEDILRFEMPASGIVRQVMRDMISHNYDRFAKMGSSSSYSGYTARTSDVTSTYSLDILYSGSGILRRSNMNIFALSNSALLHGLQVAIEAQGMESLIRATPDEGEEKLEAFAGMSALLFDVQLRPVTFFKGYNDLMSKIFSVSADPISVVRGLILLTDHSQVIQLQSGLRASAEFQGGLAIDISGGMEVSLWYRESKTSINNRGALVVVGNVTVDVADSAASAGMEVSFETEASLDFITTVQFADYPFNVCMQMEKATFPFRETVTRYERLRLPKGKEFLSRRVRSQLVPGSEFPLHQANSDMCKRIHGDGDEDGDSDW